MGKLINHLYQTEYLKELVRVLTKMMCFIEGNGWKS